MRLGVQGTLLYVPWTQTQHTHMNKRSIENHADRRIAVACSRQLRVQITGAVYTKRTEGGPNGTEDRQQPVGVTVRHSPGNTVDVVQ